MASHTASAPGKVILLGEHAVVYGKPALAMAIDLRFRCRITPSQEMTLNSFPLDRAKHPYISHILDNHWDGRPLSIETWSDIPSGSGLGSSAALCASMNAAVMASHGPYDEEVCALRSYHAELGAQGSASPVDTSASVHGRGIAVNLGEGDALWEVRQGDRRWKVSHLDVPSMTLVVGHTGVHAPTGPLVAKVRRYFQSSSFAKEIVNGIGDITVEAADRLRVGDKESLGRLMTENHKLLSILGVSGRELDKLVQAALPHSYGAKLTGAGGGGSMIALTDEPGAVCEAIERRGGRPYIIRADQPGAMIHD